MDMQTRVSDAERVAIEKEIMAIFERWNDSANQVDTSDWLTFMSDAYNLGFLGGGEMVSSTKELVENWTEGFKLLERQEDLEEPKVKLAVLSPEVVVGTSFNKNAAYYKNGTVAIAYFALTMVFVKIGGEWKLIHAHLSEKPVE